MKKVQTIPIRTEIILLCHALVHFNMVIEILTNMIPTHVKMSTEHGMKELYLKNEYISMETGAVIV